MWNALIPVDLDWDDATWVLSPYDRWQCFSLLSPLQNPC